MYSSSFVFEKTTIVEKPRSDSYSCPLIYLFRYTHRLVMIRVICVSMMLLRCVARRPGLARFRLSWCSGWRLTTGLSSPPSPIVALVVRRWLRRPRASFLVRLLLRGCFYRRMHPGETRGCSCSRTLEPWDFDLIARRTSHRASLAPGVPYSCARSVQCCLCQPGTPLCA